MVDFNSFKQSSLVHLCFSLSYFMSGLAICSVQLVLYLGLKPFNNRLYRQLNYYLLYSFYSQLVFMSEWWAGVEVSIYIDKDDYKKYYGKEHAYLIMNHSYEIDWLIGWQFCDGIEVLGNCKAYAKKSIQFIPPLGWMWKFGEFVFLERSFEKDKVTIPIQISELMDYPDPIWLLLFPEGTRFTPKKHEISQKFAKEKGLPVLTHHLTPRTKGFTMSLVNMRGKNVALYDIQLGFHPDDKPLTTMTSLLHGKKVHAHLYINRIPIDDIPINEDEAATWLHRKYEEKDRLHASFLKTGDFFAESGVKRVEPFHVPRRVYSLLNTVGWALVTLIPCINFMVSLLLNGQFLYLAIMCTILTSFYYLLQKTIGSTKISHGSSYGLEKKSGQASS